MSIVDEAIANTRDTSRYCAFYKDHNHDIEERRHLHGILE